MVYSLDTTVRYVVNLLALQFNVLQETVALVVYYMLDNLKSHEYVHRWAKERQYAVFYGIIFRTNEERDLYWNAEIDTYIKKLAFLTTINHFDNAYTTKMNVIDSGKEYSISLRSNDRHGWWFMAQEWRNEGESTSLSLSEFWVKLIQMLNKFSEF